MAKLYFLGNTTRCQMFGCVIQSGKKTIVIDGGTSADAKTLCDLLMHQSDGRVDTWFFTHPHHDRIGAFLEICKEHSDITIDCVFYNFSGLDLLKQYGSRHDEEIKMWETIEELMGLRFAVKGVYEI